MFPKGGDISKCEIVIIDSGRHGQHTVINLIRRREANQHFMMM